jgi:hypothetical protein
LSDLKVNSPRSSIEQQQQQQENREKRASESSRNKNFETTFSPLS